MNLPKKLAAFAVAIAALLAPKSTTLAAPSDPSAAPRREEKVHVVTTLAVLRSLAQEVGGDLVEAEELGNPDEDPHFVQPRPTLMKKAHDADLFVEIGLQLEMWAQKVVDGAGNPKIQPGAPGRVVASEGVVTLEQPATLSREWGDVHPYGNPHVWLDPVRVRKVAANIEAGLVRVDPSHKEQYEARLKAFTDKLDRALFGEELVKQVGATKLCRLCEHDELDDYLTKKNLGDKLGGWLKKAAPLKGRPVVTYHKTFVYFAHRFGLTIPFEIEEKPGIPPSAKHVDSVIQRVTESKVKTIVHENYYPRATSDFVAEKTGAHVVPVPIDLAASSGATDYFAFVDLLLDKILASETAQS
jgi:ABC-type Zn uptake system ZnuABC Zn-binding protein ZnuA